MTSFLQGTATIAKCSSATSKGLAGYENLAFHETTGTVGKGG